MADTTYSVRIEDKTKEKITKLIESSDFSSKDFMAEMVQIYELNKAKNAIPVLEQDITELQNLTKRINSIYINMGERLLINEKSKEEELNLALSKKESIITTLQEKISELEISKSTLSEDLDLYKEKFEDVKESNKILEDKNIEDVKKFEEISQSNKALIEEYKNKIETLTGIVEEYKNFKTENVELDKQNSILAKENNDLKMTNSKLENDVNNLNEDLKLKDINNDKNLDLLESKLKLENENLILENNKLHQIKIEELHEKYNDKVFALLNQIESIRKDNDEK